MEKPVIILGAKGLGKVALDIFKSNDVVVYCLLDDDAALHHKEIDDVMVMGSTEDEAIINLIGDKTEVFVANDDNKFRKSIVEALLEGRKVMPVNAIHKNASIEKTAVLGHGTLFASGVIIGTSAKIGNHCIVNANAVVEYDAELDDFVQIGAGSIIGSGVKIGEGAFVGAGAVIVGGIKIGKKAQIGAGSVVVADVAANSKVFGNPAQVIK
jgi:sugar O-acyltransferase (sialic acid O-acetyltransferase NeuD family)